MQLEDFANMGLLLQNLNESRLHSRETFKDLPQQGVYVFYDSEKPVYVGRSSRNEPLPHSGNGSGVDQKHTGYLTVPKSFICFEQRQRPLDGAD